MSPRVVEFPAECEVLDALPVLPVRVLVVTADGVEEQGRRSLADRLERTAESLGVAEGLVVAQRPRFDWQTTASSRNERFDVIFFRPGVIPADAKDDRLPAAHMLDGLQGLLVDSRTRFWLLDPGCAEEHDSRLQQRCEALCRNVVSGGGPPAVLIPPQWDSDRKLRFHQSLLEWSLHDAPLDLAVGRATGSAGPVPVLFLPSGRRHGLDLGRLLEDYRRRIDGTYAALRMLSAELASLSEGGTEGELRVRLQQDSQSWLADLDMVKQSCDEINRDRDPAGWSRLRASLKALRQVEQAVATAREEIVSLHAQQFTAEEPH
jgi:hypothetical protein